MLDWPKHPKVYEINVWVWLGELSERAGRRLTLAEIPEAELSKMAECGFDAVWLMGVWRRSPASRAIAQRHSGLQAAFRAALPGYSQDDIVGSPYAVCAYEVDAVLGGDGELSAFRGRLARLGIRLILDFVPNHLAVDHPWLGLHPERMLRGSPDGLIQQPGIYFRRGVGQQASVFAHGRDPFFDGWTDTAQLDYRVPATRQAMTRIVRRVAERCDGVRCDMAMLLLSSIFLRTWGGAMKPPDAEFWSEAISSVRAQSPGFLFLAEAYWDTEWRLQELGFDYVYDKRLYDRLLRNEPLAVQEHLRASIEYQRRLARFVENHDEQRATVAFGRERSRAAATIVLTLPGLRLFHEGQLDGRRYRTPVQLGRRRVEEPDPLLSEFYEMLLRALQDPVFRTGEWRLLEPAEAWHGNTSHQSFIAHRWQGGSACRLSVANLSPSEAQCYVRLDASFLAGREWRLVDLLGRAEYQRDGDRLLSEGLYLDVPGNGYHLFDFQPV